MSNEVRTENKMGTKPMLPLILTMSLPAMFSMTIMAMYNVVDSIFIGNYDQAGLTAISLAYPLQLFLIAAFHESSARRISIWRIPPRPTDL